MIKSVYFRRSYAKHYMLCMFFILFVLTFFFNKLSHKFSPHTKHIALEISKGQENVGNVEKLRLVISQPKRCAKNTNFLIAVMSSPIDFSRREIIRRTWGMPSEIGAVQASLLFFIGKSTSKKVQARIEKETATYEDIVLFDIIDDYDYLSTKTIYMMRWFIKFCGHAQWFIKTDVDAFWNLYLLNSILLSKNQQKVVENYKKFWLKMKAQGKTGDFTKVNARNLENRRDGNKIIRLGNNLTLNLGVSASKPKNTLQRTSENNEFKSKQNQEQSHLKSESPMSLTENQPVVSSEDRPGIICAKAKGLVVCRKPEYDRCEKRYVVTKEEYSSEIYPPHCHGFGYAVQTKVVKKILLEDHDRAEKRESRFRMEDVYITGILLNNTAVKFLDISEVTETWPRRRSLSASLLLHDPQRRLGPGSARFLWENMKYFHMLASGNGS